MPFGNELRSQPETASGRLLKYLSEVGSEVSRYGEAYFLPFQIESLILSNIGPFERFEAHFNRNSVNLVCGPGGSGKSIALRAILFAFGRQHRYFDERALDNGVISVKLFAGQNSVKITGNERHRPCIIADDSFERMREAEVIPFINELNSLKDTQTIATARRLDVSKLPEDVNVVHTRPSL